MNSTIRRRLWIAALSGLGVPAASLAVDVSQPVVLQYFESTYSNVEYRMPDVFAAGYGQVYTPPPGRADSGNQSVGYDQYDRFDLGSAGNSTLYGTETGLKTVVKEAQRAGLKYGVDLVWNHSGFSDWTTPGFPASGAYPGFYLGTGSITNTGDYHANNASGDELLRLSGLIDIAQESNNLYIRNPIGPNAQNIPAGTTSSNGRLANVPNAANIRFYPSVSNSITVNDPANGASNVPIYNFDTNNPSNGTAVAENALGYLMRNTRWLVQSAGVDFFRLDATKNMPAWVLNYYDRAVFKASNRNYLNGAKMPVWGFGEAYDGSAAVLQPRIRYGADLNSNTVGGNRDTKDFPFFFAVRDNLGNSPSGNNWNNIVGQTIDTNDGGLLNGSQGVKFVSSADDFGPYLSNVAHAYMLMTPGNAIVYHNAHQFGLGRTFPKDGRGDALGGVYGNTITELVDLRNRYGRGNYATRLVEQNQYAFERQGSALVLLSNRTDAGFDSRTIQTAFPAGTPLVELTGNAGDATADPNHDIARVLIVDGTGKVNAKFLRNSAPSTGSFTGAGYLVYGLATPRGTFSVVGNTGSLAGANANISMGGDTAAFNNATTRVSNIPIIKGNSFTVNLNTSSVTLDNYGTLYRDQPADGDNALLKIDGGLNVNGNAGVDFTDPANDVVYGFEQFVNTRVPGYTSPNGAGTYSQSVDATNLPEGYHYITARAFRFRNDNGPAVFTDFKTSVYVDRFAPISAIDSFNQNGATTADRQLRIKSTDGTANAVHAFLDIPTSLSDSQILALVNSGNKAGQIDRDLFAYGFSVGSGLHTIVTVTFEATGTYTINRSNAVSMTTSRGLGLGDVQYDNDYDSTDVSSFQTVLNAQGAQFNAASDLNADGSIDNRDLWKLPGLYQNRGASTATLNAAKAAVRSRGNVNLDSFTNATDIDFLYTKLGVTNWTYDLDVSGGATTQADIDVLVRTVLGTEYGDTNPSTAASIIDSIDFATLVGNFGMSNVGWASGDFTGDRKVTTLDFNLLAGNFGFTGQGSNGIPQPWVEPAPTLGAIVPEPSSILIITGLLSGLLCRRIKR